MKYSFCFLLKIWNKDTRKNWNKLYWNENNHNSVLWEKRSTVWELLDKDEDATECLLSLLLLLLLFVMFVVVSNDDDVVFALIYNERRCVAIASTRVVVIVRTGACNETGKFVWS